MTKSHAKNATQTPAPQGPAFSSRREAIRATRLSKEAVDPTPVELPVNSDKPPSLREEMMRFIRVEMSRQAEKDNLETFDEFDDFKIDDEEPDLSSPYTVQMADEPGSYLLEPEPENASEAPTGAENDTSDAEGDQPSMESGVDTPAEPPPEKAE